MKRLNPEQLLELAERVVDELLAMHNATGIDLNDRLPACKELVDTLRCGSAGEFPRQHLWCAKPHHIRGEFHSTNKDHRGDRTKRGVPYDDPVASRSVAR